MTREEAIDYNKNLRMHMKLSDKNQPCKFPEKNYIALDMAIKALEQESCEDCISRKAVLDALNKTSGIRGDALKALYDLPPVTPQPKTGHWIKVTNGRGGHECDVCHDYAPSFQSGDEYLSTFCPNCGAKMERSDKE